MIECKTYEFPRGTPKGQFQLWIDGNWAENITDKIIEAKGDLMTLYGRDLTNEWET